MPTVVSILMRSSSGSPPRVSSRSGRRDPALVHFLDFLRSLPEKQIGADRGAQHRHHHQEVIGIDGGLRPDRRQQRRAPGNLHGQRRYHIGEQRQRHEFQHRRIAAIRHEDLQQGRCRRENQRVFVVEAADHQRERFAHRRDIGGDVEGVRGDQKENQRQHQPARRQLHHIGGEALAGDPADLRAHQLDGDHERRGEKHRPEQAVTELRAGLRIGGDARRVVIGGAGHQARTEQPEHHVPGFFGLWLFNVWALGFGHEIL